jgi:hypothetical protein
MERWAGWSPSTETAGWVGAYEKVSQEKKASHCKNVFLLTASVLRLAYKRVVLKNLILKS